MVAPAITGGNDLTKRINIFCLVAAILIVLVLPFKKEIWYDETVSILCSKGISHDTPAQFANATSISSVQIEQLNTSANVFSATVNDNANSFLYNYKLHWFTEIFGNSVSAYMMLSKLCAIITLMAFYVLARQFFKHSLFTGLAVLLLVTDLNFISMSHEIRAYAMGTMFITLAAIFFYKFLLQEEKPLYLFLVASFSVGAVLCHFLSVYIILVFLGALFFYKRASLFTGKNIVAVLVPVLFLGAFIYCAYAGLGVMNMQSNTIHEGYSNYGFQLSEVFSRSMKYMAMNFKMVFPAFKANPSITIFSFLLVIALYLLSLRAASSKDEKRNLHLLFILGTISTVFLLLLSIKSHHYASLYFRYHSFGLPFCTLFITYLLYVCYYSPKVNSIAKYGLSTIGLIPALAFFAKGVLNEPLHIRYNHSFIASSIVKYNLTKIEVPEWKDAMLVNTLLPQGYKIDYFRNPEGVYFTLFKSTGVEKIPAIKE